MSKAFVRLNDNMSLYNTNLPTALSTIKQTTDSGRFKKYLLLALIVGVLITIFACWWRYTENDYQESFDPDYHNQEFFDPDYPGSTDSFPARVESNATINRAGQCNTPFRPGHNHRRSILRKGRKIGYVRPYDQNEIEKERDRQNRRVTWSDPLIEIMGA